MNALEMEFKKKSNIVYLVKYIFTRKAEKKLRNDQRCIYTPP